MLLNPLDSWWFDYFSFSTDRLVLTKQAILNIFHKFHSGDCLKTQKRIYNYYERENVAISLFGDREAMEVTIYGLLALRVR